MQQHLQAIVTILSLVNPLVCGAMFARAAGHRPPSAQLADATRAALTVLVILTLAALCGAKVLDLFGVSLDAFAVAGGGVLSWIGFSMMNGGSSSSDSTAAPTSNPDGEPTNSALTPVILFAASPGTITGVITLAVAHGKQTWPITALVAVAVAAFAMWGVMLLVARAGNRSNGGGFVRDIVTRFMGLIVIAMGVQFALTGIKGFMAGGA